MDVKSLLILYCFCILILYFNPLVEGDSSEYYGFCANPECSIPVSRGTVVIHYNSPDSNRISAEPNDEAEIYVKDYGPKKDLWGVIVKGNRGYISKQFIRENTLFAKRLVPAAFEFKTSILVPGSLTDSSHLHASSFPQSGDLISNVVPQSDIYSQTAQLHPSSVSNNFQQQQLQMQQQQIPEQQISYSGDLQASQFSPSLNPSDPVHFDSSFNQELHVSDSAQSSQFQSHTLHGYSGDLQASHFSPSLNPSDPVHFDSSFNQESQVFDGVQSSQFQSGNILPPTYMSGVQSQNILPSQTHAPVVGHSSPHQSFPSEEIYDSVLNAESIFAQTNILDFSQSGNIDPNSIYASQFPPVQQSTHNNPSIQHQFSQSSSVPEMHSSFLENTIDDEYTSTMAMLSRRGFDDSEIMANSYSESHIHPSSQNLDNLDLSEEELNLITSQSQYIQTQSSGSSSYSSASINQEKKEEINLGPSKTFKEFSGNIDQPPENIAVKEEKSTAVKSNNDENVEDENEAHEVLAETDEDSEDEEIEEEEEVEEAETNDVTVNEATVSSETGSNLQSSMSANQNKLQASYVQKNIESSSITSPGDSNVIDPPSKKYSLFNDKEKVSNEPLSSSRNFAHLETKTPEEIPTLHSTVEFKAETNDATVNKATVSSKAESNLKSSMSVNQNKLQTSDVQKNIESFSVTSPGDTNVIDPSSKKYSLFNDIEKASNEPLSSSKIFEQLETKTPDEIPTLHSTVEFNAVGNAKYSADLNVTHSNLVETVDVSSNTITNLIADENSVHQENVDPVVKPYPEKDTFSRTSNDAIPTEKDNIASNINELFIDSEKNSDLDNILSPVDIERMSDDLATYQVRNLKGEFATTEEQQSDSDGSNDENSTQFDSEAYSSIENWLYALKSIVDSIMSWIPEPLYSALMDLQNKGISPRVPVFTAVCGFICIFLIVPVLYIKEGSKESRLSAHLACVEKKAYELSATNTILEEKLESVQSELAAVQASLTEKKTVSENLKMEFETQEEDFENARAEIESCLQVIDSLKEKENEYLSVIQEQEKDLERFAEHKEALDKIMKDQENQISDLNDQLQEKQNKLEEFEKEKEQFLQLKEDYEEKLALFDKNCSTLLQEAEVWNLRVQELTTNMDEERKVKQELVDTVKVKDEEIESLKELVEMFKIIEEIEDPEEQAKTKEEKLEFLMNTSAIVNQLKQEEEKSKLLLEQLEKEKSRILDMEVELLEAKSEIDKLKLSYNQALQDKAEAQTKLDVLTNYFKDKEIQLQKQLGAQEAVRQKKEEDASSAERRICLIEQENASYKYQVASMKQEMEETERNLKTQIAAQEKKAHENWIAARAAERKLEDMKQEVTQLRQRLTLLEREQENWANSSRDEIIRPVPKRMPGVNDEPGSQDLNTSERGMFPPPPLHDRLGMVPPMMLPPDRPLPPLRPPPIPPMFLPHMERHFRPQPWHIPPDHSSDYRMTPPEFMGGRETTPPRGRPSTLADGEAGPHASSPLTTDTRDSRNSTPPHLLPDFHDVPPQPGRPFFPPPPPLGHPRLPMPPPFRRDGGPGPKRLDHPNDFNPRGQQQPPPPQEHWQHSRV